MDRSIALLALGLIFGGGIGFTIAAANGIALDGHDHADAAQHAGSGGGHRHDMAPRSLPGGTDAPTLDVEMTKDAVSGWNLRIKTTHFSFAPEHASGGPVPGQGHAHVYVSGVKVGRYYGPWVHLGPLERGAKVKVTLNGNDHRPLAVDGIPLAKVLTVGGLIPRPAQ